MAVKDDGNIGEKIGQVSSSESGQQKSSHTDFRIDNKDELDYLKSIDESLKKLLSDGGKVSQSNARNSMGGRNDRRNALRGGLGFTNSKDEFLRGFQKELFDGLLGSDFKDKLRETFNGMADQLGVDLKDIPNELGKQLGKQAMSKLKDTAMGQKLTGWIGNTLNGLSGKLVGLFGRGASGAAGAAATSSAGTAAATGATAGVGAAAGTALATKAAAGGAAASGGTTALAVGGGAGAAGAAAAGGPPAWVILAAVVLVVKALETLGPAIEGTTELLNKAKASMNRVEESRKKNLELEKKRLAADVESMIRYPFEILEKAAQKAYDVWDNNLRLITGTQGYNKADLQTLMANYAERLRDENLSSVIGTTDVTENLGKVLQSGLSGKVAEEFAYLATLLNAAIPTQDFFSYASNYSTIAANAIKSGMSQAEAIEYANSQLKIFASEILYASRNLAGGFSTGLKDAQSLFEDSVKIAQASKTGTPANIASVLASVAAVIGAIAPDLATSMIDAIVKSATGGNSSEIVALRSLAGINASNTEFLKKLSENPKEIFSTLFRNLSNMQNMAPGAYMEVAEGLSSVFGISMDAFARIDFNYLADQIANMNISSASLDDNMDLLISGQTTTTAEQQKIAQINKYMIEEGLSYVLDNEAARSIQEHMWQEQIARELQEAEYSVNLKGAALEFLQGIKQTVENIINFLNPFAWMKKIESLIGTIKEADSLNEDIAKMLGLGKVGYGNELALSQLTTRNADLNLTSNLIEMLGGQSGYYKAASERKQSEQAWQKLANTSFAFNIGGGLANPLMSLGLAHLAYNSNPIQFGNTISGTSSPIYHSNIYSKYSWGSSKKGQSLYKKVYDALFGGTTSISPSGTSESQNSSVNILNKMLSGEYIDKFIENGGYSAWLASAKGQGLNDVAKAIEDAGLTESAIKNQFAQRETQKGAEIEAQRRTKEETFWADTLAWEPEIKDLVTSTNSWLEKIFKKSDEFYNSWVDYFVKHTAYNNAYTFADVERIAAQSKAQESGDLVNALAMALTQNTVDLNDPTVQTNALLSQILIVIQMMMQQNNKTGGLSLMDTLTGSALGFIKQS